MVAVGSAAVPLHPVPFCKRTNTLSRSVKRDVAGDGCGSIQLRWWYVISEGALGGERGSIDGNPACGVLRPDPHREVPMAPLREWETLLQSCDCVHKLWGRLLRNFKVAFHRSTRADAWTALDCFQDACFEYLVVVWLAGWGFTTDTS